MTYALLALAALLVAFLAYRLAKLPAALAAKKSPLKLLDGGLPTGHMVFSGPLEHNEHGFITTPLVPCQAPECPCRTFRRIPNA